MASVFTFNKDGKYDGYVGNAMYHLIPTLLELPDIKCGEFREKFNKLIDDLVSDINNINDPSKKMLYDDNIHLKNAREVIRAMFACFNCILQKIKDENNTVNCIEKSETNLENPILNMSKSLGILQQTFNLTGPEIEDEGSINSSSTSSSSSTPMSIRRSSSTSSDISSITDITGITD